jgi:uncharacterized protein
VAVRGSRKLRCTLVFSGFLFHLRASGLRVSTTEWLGLMDAVARGHAKSSLHTFYALARAVLVKKESQYDIYDRAFATYFEGVEGAIDVDDEFLKWLEEAIPKRELSEEERRLIESWDLDKLRAELDKRLREQRRRHDGGNRWIGTGGTSPFGHGGENPSGIRIGGAGGGRTAVQVAESRRFENLRRDRVLDTRYIGVALRRLRRLVRNTGPEELDLDKTIDKSAREGGDIDIVFSPARANRIKLLLLMDVGGSMDPHVEVSEQLFAAAHAAHHFKAFKHYFFHNCVYGRLYTDISRYAGKSTDEVFRRDIDQTWSVVLVGDAWMAPDELVHPSAAFYWGDKSRMSGIDWLRRLRGRCPNSIWLNPEPQSIWGAPTVRAVRHVFPMFPLTLDGLAAGVDVLRGAKPNHPDFQGHESTLYKPAPGW